MEQMRVSYQLVVTVMMCLVCLGSSFGMSSESDPLIRTYVSSSLPSNDDLLYSVQSLTESQWDSLVIQSNLPVMVMFTAVWCGPCRLMVPVLYKLDLEFKDQFKFYTVDIDDEEGIRSRYHIRAIPSTVVFKGGDKMAQYTGANPGMLHQLVEKYK